MLSILATAAAVAHTTMHLHLMQDKVASGAVCLDGGPGGFYYSVAGNANNANDWQVWLQGGGWCYDDMDCWGRSSTRLGSHKSWASTEVGKGIMSGNCTDNPEFCNFNRVYIAYCDGTSYSGNIEGPVTVPGKPTPIYYRGRRLLDAVFDTLTEQFGLASAKRFLFMGSSAGGLGAFMHTDYVHERVLAITNGELEVFKSIPISGFFLDHVNVANEHVYGQEIRYQLARTNSTPSTNGACVAAMEGAGGNVSDCFFAPNIYNYIQAPTFILNSAYDSWQTQCIFTPKLVPGWPKQTATTNGLCNQFPYIAKCQENPENCNQTQIVTMMSYMSDFLTTIKSKSALSRPGNGAFLYSCHTHDTAITPDFTRFSVNGTTMQQATSKWWNSPVTTPAAENTYYPCMYHTGPTGPRICNPSCTQSEEIEREFKKELHQRYHENEIAYRLSQQ
eukprot:TRINITY_DN2770_c0_g1_i1.p1 TRINITY_DN2770_c0_g1~~TRINITY_DN2770_c0_g1_i1.p1  ORF type:complete len:447 (+),score=75.28 TRINITY_DN2770_c0_g1_i1:68-1408(+)